MKQILIFASLICASQALSWATSSTSTSRNPRISARDCKAPGKQCANCKTAIWCTALGNGSYDYEILDECDTANKFSCLNGKCTADSNPSCGTDTSVQFSCTDRGIFPDPYNCSIYYLCCSDNSKTEGIICDKGYIYDPRTTYCKPGTSCPLNWKINCNELGTVIKNNYNPSIYYICVYITDANGNKILYPKTHLCRNSKTFNGTTCV